MDHFGTSSDRDPGHEEKAQNHLRNKKKMIIDFKCNRPFSFYIADSSGMIMFSGAVNKLHGHVEIVPEPQRRIFNNPHENRQEMELMNNNSSLLRNMPVIMEGVSARYVNSLILNLNKLLISDAHRRHLTNYVFSPVLLYVGLSMIQEGTSGHAQNELDEKLGIPRRPD